MKINRLEIYKKYDGHCAYCGIDIDFANMQIDHIDPRRYPDRDSMENLNPACPICNNWKHCDNLESFRRSIQCQVRKCRDYSRNFRMAERYGLVEEIKRPIVFYFERIENEMKWSTGQQNPIIEN
jgi:hypothetical protein